MILNKSFSFACFFCHEPHFGCGFGDDLKFIEQVPDYVEAILAGRKDIDLTDESYKARLICTYDLRDGDFNLLLSD